MKFEPWMEDLRKFVELGAPDSAEEMLKDKTDVFRVNAYRAMVAVEVKAKVQLLHQMKKAGMLNIGCPCCGYFRCKLFDKSSKPNPYMRGEDK